MPNTPVDFIVANRPNGNTIELTWNNGLANGATNIQYRVFTDYNDGVARSDDSGALNARGYTKTGLVNGRTYTFRVRAFNNIGSSGDATITTGAGAPPAQPTNVQTQLVDASTKVRGTWTRGSDNGNAILGCKVEVRSGSLAFLRAAQYCEENSGLDAAALSAATEVSGDVCTIPVTTLRNSFSLGQGQ